MRSLALAAVLVCFGGVARAGLCEVPGAYETIAEALDQRAAEAHPHAAAGEFATCLRTQMTQAPASAPKLAKRMLAACETILDKAPADGFCAELVARLGVAELGTHDIVALLATRKNAMADYLVNEMFAATHAPRAAAIVIARWQELQSLADRNATNADMMQDWAAWRTRAADALGELGDADAKAFLAGQVTRPIDRGVKRACAAAILAIDKRLASK